MLWFEACPTAYYHFFLPYALVRGLPDHILSFEFGFLRRSSVWFEACPTAFLLEAYRLRLIGCGLPNLRALFTSFQFQA